MVSHELGEDHGLVEDCGCKSVGAHLLEQEAGAVGGAADTKHVGVHVADNVPGGGLRRRVVAVEANDVVCANVRDDLKVCSMYCGAKVEQT